MSLVEETSGALTPEKSEEHRSCCQKPIMSTCCNKKFDGLRIDDEPDVATNREGHGRVSDDNNSIYSKVAKC